MDAQPGQLGFGWGWAWGQAGGSVFCSVSSPYRRGIRANTQLPPAFLIPGHSPGPRQDGQGESCSGWPQFLNTHMTLPRPDPVSHRQLLKWIRQQEARVTSLRNSRDLRR